MQHRRLRVQTGIWLAFTLVFSSAQLAAQDSTEADWLERSNAIAYRVLEMGAGFAPEFSGQTGVEGLDEEIFDLGPELYERRQAVEHQKLEYLESMLVDESDPRVV